MKTYHFISHTHWDREWYLTFEQFRYRLVDLVDKLLDLLDRDPEFKHFHLDGQTIVLEDYCALRPGNRERLEAHIRAGRILIGPWYQQNDLFLTSAESTVRNLIEGIRLSRRLGGEMKVGYLPDHFGLPGQMPQIFRGVGIDNCIHGRGYHRDENRDSSFYRWRSPDGSEVTGIHLYHWYNSAQRLPAEEGPLFALFDRLREREERMNPLGHFAMMNGVDHLEAQEDLPEVLEKLRRKYGHEAEFVHGTLPDFVRCIQQKRQERPELFPLVEGELREGGEYGILAGTLSSRVYIKQANAAAHDLLEKWVEPLSAWCALLGLDRYEWDTLRYAWKLYMQNHPHDSICGCSQDAVHDQMMDRYQRLAELCGEIIDRKMKVLARQIANVSLANGERTLAPEDHKLVVFNTSQLDAVIGHRATVYFLEEDRVRKFALFDAEGREVPYRLLSARLSRIFVLSPNNLPGDVSVTRYDIEFAAQVPALGYVTYHVRPHLEGRIVKDEAITLASPSAPEHPVSLPVLENGHLRVELQKDGTFHLLDKATGRIWRHQGKFEDAGDAGDLYVFRKTADPPLLSSGEAVFVHWLKNELFQECVYEFAWDVPAQLDSSLRKRADDTVAMKYRVTLRLYRHARHVDIKVEMDNRAKDHRVRLLFPQGGRVDGVWAGGPFDVVQRAWDEGARFGRDANSQPFWKWFAPVRDGNGLAVFARGLHDYEIVDEGRVAGVTLLRGVETIHERKPVYLEIDYQPKGQCPGSHVFELAVRPFAMDEANALRTQLYREAELWHQGVRSKLFPVDEQRWSRGRAWVQTSDVRHTFTTPDPNRDKPRLPASASLIRLTGNILLSAMKWSEDNKAPVLRLYNVEEQESAIGLQWFAEMPDTVTETNLLEEPVAAHATKNGQLSATVGAKKIVTYRL